jgi:N6-L-threonylcarbamoyladenine synthase
MLGLSYPGGALVEKLAQNGNRNIKFPVPQMPDFDFSFSGLKTAVLYYLKDANNPKHEDIACSFQEVVIDFLLKKVQLASDNCKIKQIGISGGVAINNRIRERFKEYGKKNDMHFYFPQPSMCTDNAAMITAAGIERFIRFGPSTLSLSAESRVKLPEN